MREDQFKLVSAGFHFLFHQEQKQNCLKTFEIIFDPTGLPAMFLGKSNVSQINQANQNSLETFN